MKSRLQQQIDFIAEIDRAKKVIRQTSLMDGSRQENDAEHSWHIAIMALILSEYANKPIDTLKVLKMLLIHDLVEIDAGDVFVYDEESNRDEKRKREHKAANRIFGLLPDDQAKDFLEIWLEFEDQETPEARFAKALDDLQPVLQGFFNRGWSWKTHHIRMGQVLKKKSAIKDGSLSLWEFTKELIAIADDNGYFFNE